MTLGNVVVNPCVQSRSHVPPVSRGSANALGVEHQLINEGRVAFFELLLELI